MAWPQNWIRRRLRFDARLNPVKSGLSLPDDAEVSFVPMDAVGELGGLRLDQERAVDEVYNGYTYFCNDDVVVAKITPCFENGKGAIAAGLTNGVAFGTTELHVVRAGEALDERFLFYITIAHDFRSFGAAEMLGAGGQKRVPERFLKDWRAALPSLEIQKCVAAFLDEKTARIDALIEKKRSLLDRLAEKRQATITQAVTKGLNPAAPMKDSGIDWLGEIPAHWEVKSLRWYIRIRSGEALRNEDMSVDLTEVDTISVIGGNGLMGYTSKSNSDGVGIIIGRVGALCGNVHPVRTNSWITDNALCISKVQNFYVEYLTLQLRVRNLNILATRNAQPLMTGEMVKAQQLAHPPINEQIAIAVHAYNESKSLDQVGLKISEGLGRLQEYRSALITAAVTGQIEGLR
jgi:type I restriction enzyme, S subunit